MQHRARTIRPLRRVLIANRGEIAVRIIRGCRAAGVEAAAVYSEADRDAPHVWLADRAIEIGPAPARHSYLDGERILAAARAVEADGIHPGYGFLAENADFAVAVEAAGLVWIGPPPAAIRAMGEKTAARRAMEAAGVPVIPGTLESLADVAAARAAAAQAGYPVLLKAAAGGGGKGMRVVPDVSALAGAFRAAASEARNAFGDPAVYLETYLPAARHVEIQILADQHDHVIHLGERECSLQRRHQKVIEEAPAPGLSAATRATMGDVAVRAARAVGYVGAGTVEFLLGSDGAFYFLEMNTRLQVEHPVTEAVTGLDLVGLQLAIAAGEVLPLAQENVVLRGHAIECRIAAEDPAAGFLPATGRITRWREPGGPGIRVDSGIATGQTVTPHYDPLLAKVIAWAPTRDEALNRLAAAVAETELVGCTTNLPFLGALLDDPAVRRGAVHTRYLEDGARGLLEGLAARRAAEEPLAVALAAWQTPFGGGAESPPVPEASGPTAWRQARRFVWYR